MAKKKSKNDPQQQLINLQAQQLAAQVANWAAQLEFQKQRLQVLELPQFQAGDANQKQQLMLDADKFAWEKATDEWKKAFQEAALTGKYQGQDTTEWLTQQAQLTGVLNGQQTLQGRMTDAQIAQMNHAMELENNQFLAQTTGYYNGQSTFARQQFEAGATGYYNGQKTLEREQQEAGLTGYYNGQKTFGREQFEAQQGLEGLKILSSLQGAGNAFKQLRVLGAMGTTGDLANAWIGRYTMPGATGSGQAPGQAQISDLMQPYGNQGGNAIGQSLFALPGPAAQPTQPTFAQPQMAYAAKPTPQLAQPTSDPNMNYAMGATPIAPYGGPVGYSVDPAGTPANPTAWNYGVSGTGQVQVYPPGIPAPPDQHQISTSVPISADQAAQAAQAHDPYNAGVAGTGLLNPNQINAKNYANTNAYAQQLGWAAFEDQGWDVGAAQDAFRKSLPRYGGPAMGSYAA